MGFNWTKLFGPHISNQTPVSTAKNRISNKYNTYNAYTRNSIGPKEENEEPIPSFFPVEMAKPFMYEFISKASEDDVRKLLQAAFETLSKDTNTIKMSEGIESALFQYIIETQA